MGLPKSTKCPETYAKLIFGFLFPCISSFCDGFSTKKKVLLSTKSSKYVSEYKKMKKKIERKFFLSNLFSTNFIFLLSLETFVSKFYQKRTNKNLGKSSKKCWGVPTPRSVGKNCWSLSQITICRLSAPQKEQKIFSSYVSDDFKAKKKLQKKNCYKKFRKKRTFFSESRKNNLNIRFEV